MPQNKKPFYVTFWDGAKNCSSVLAVLTNFSIIIAAAFWLADLDDAYFSREKDAWDIIASKNAGQAGAGSALSFLNQNVWMFKNKNSLDYVNLASKSKSERIIVSNNKLENFSANFSNFSFSQLENYIFSSGSLLGAKFLNSTIANTKFYEVKLAGAVFNNSSIINSEINEADISGASFKNSTILNSNFTKLKSPVGRLNFDTKKITLHGINLEGSNIFDSKILYKECNDLSLKSSTIGNVTISGKKNETDSGLSLNDTAYSGCRIVLNNSKLATVFIDGFEVIKCEDCLIMNSDLTFKKGAFFKSQPNKGRVIIEYDSNKISKSELVGVLILGDASCSSFENSNFFHVDMSKSIFEGVNVSGVDFNFQFDSSKIDSLLSRKWIYEELYSTKNTFLDPWYEEWIDQELNLDTSPQVIKKYFPEYGLSRSWAWSDNLPKNIPLGIEQPIICEAALRKKDYNSSGFPIGCKPKELKVC
jgi:uncharacterized protein YjbI with pentapeptide repeats